MGGITHRGKGVYFTTMGSVNPGADPPLPPQLVQLSQLVLLSQRGPKRIRLDLTNQSREARWLLKKTECYP